MSLFFIGQSGAIAAGPIINLSGAALTSPTHRTHQTALSDGDLVDGRQYVWTVTKADGHAARIVGTYNDDTTDNISNYTVTEDNGVSSLSVSDAVEVKLMGEVENVIDFSDINPISRTDSDTISVAAGKAVVDGVLLSWSSALTADITSGSDPADAEQLAHIYLYSNAGTPTLELTANTEPAWDEGSGHWIKTGDASRRWIGAWPIYLDGATYKFAGARSVWDGARLSIYYEGLNGTTDDWTRSDWWAISGGAATTPTQITLPFCPITATEGMCNCAISGGSAATDVTIGVGPESWGMNDGGGPNGARNSVFTARIGLDSGNLEGAYFGRSWLPITTPQKMYYALVVTGTSISAFVGLTGWRARL